MSEIKIPSNKQSLRIKHLKAVTDAEISEVPTLTEKIIFLADLTGSPLYELKKLNLKDIDKLYHVGVMAFRGFEIGEPPKEIVLDGISFTMIDPRKVASGWHIDWQNTDGIKDPVKLACLFYFPTGETYGATDGNGNLINPISDRYDLFKEHFPLEVFLECNAFFLKIFEKSISLQLASLQGILLGQKIKRVLKNLSGKRLFTRWRKSSQTVTGSK